MTFQNSKFSCLGISSSSVLPDDVSSPSSVGSGARETFPGYGSLTVSDFFFLFGGGLLISSDLLLIVTLLSNKFLECFVFLSLFSFCFPRFSILICFLCRIQTHSDSESLSLSDHSLSLSESESDTFWEAVYPAADLTAGGPQNVGGPQNADRAQKNYFELQ